MRHALSVIVMLASAAAGAEGLIDLSSVNQQVQDLGDRAHDSAHNAFAGDDPARDAKAKGKAKGKRQKSTGLIDMTPVNEKASSISDDAHQKVQGQLKPDSKTKSSPPKRSAGRAAKPKSASSTSKGTAAPSS